MSELWVWIILGIIGTAALLWWIFTNTANDIAPIWLGTDDDDELPPDLNAQTIEALRRIK